MHVPTLTNSSATEPCGLLSLEVSAMVLEQWKALLRFQTVQLYDTNWSDDFDVDFADGSPSRSSRELRSNTIFCAQISKLPSTQHRIVLHGAEGRPCATACSLCIKNTAICFVTPQVVFAAVESLLITLECQLTATPLVRCNPQSPSSEQQAPPVPRRNEAHILSDCSSWQGHTMISLNFRLC